MKIVAYAVKNYQFTLVLFLMAMLLGVTTLFNMPRAEDPELNSPIFPVLVVYPGTSPADMEELVVKPIEKKVYELENIKRVRTSISDGVAVFQVEYKYNTNADNDYQELVREVNSVRSELPADLAKLEINRVKPSDVNIIQTALISENASYDALKKSADRLKEQLEKITSLKNVKIYGLPDREVRVELNTDKMARLHIPINAVLGAVQSEKANIPGGSIEAGSKVFSVKTSGNYTSPEEIGGTVISSSEGRNIYLRDIATLSSGFAEDKHICRLNGHRCIFVDAAQKDGANISQTRAQYAPVLEAFKKTLPSNIDMVQHFDQATNVNNRLSGLGKDFLIAILLVAITLLPLGNRAAIIVMISIPLSLAIGLVLINLLGFSLNQLSIVGLVVALGLLVDDSIVVVENIERWIREGHSRREAAIKATGQIGLAVVGCTATLVIAFMPLLFLPEASGDFIRSLPVAVLSCVLASMLVALTIIPFLSSVLLKNHEGGQGNLFLRVLQKLIHVTYARLLNRALGRPVLSLIVALGLFVGSFFLMKVIGFALFPASEKPQFVIDITTPLQTNLSRTDTVARSIEAELRQDKNVRYFATNTGEGNPRIYYNVLPENERSDYAQIFVQLDEHVSPADKLKLIEQYRAKFRRYAGARIEVKNFEQGPPLLAPVEVRLFGDNVDSLRAIAARVETLLKKTPGTMYVNNPVSNLKSDIRIAINRDKASALGIATAEIDKTVRLAVAGLDMGKFSDASNEDYSIRVTVPHGDNGKASLDVFNNLFVNSYNGTPVPLSQVAEIRPETSPLLINHYNKVRTVSVTAFARQGVQIDAVLNSVIKDMDGMKLPDGYSYSMGGEIESRQQSFGGFGSIIIVTVFLFIAVLILEFRTFKSTLIVLSVIPLGIIGAVVALWLTGNPLSFVAIIGLIALAGIEVKNSILLVDFTNQLRAGGKSLDDAIREAGEIRFLPIILTSLTAIGGLIPIALSSNPLISPLAIVLIGGLISSTLLSRIVTPVVYKLIPPHVDVKPAADAVAPETMSV